MTVLGVFLLIAGKGTTTKSSGSSFLLILLLVAGVGYFIFIRPQQQRARKQRMALSDIDVGDEILTTGGVVGTVLAMDGDRVTIVSGLTDQHGGNGAGPDAATPHRMVLVRRAIVGKIDPVVPAEDDAGGASVADDSDDETDDSGDDSNGGRKSGRDGKKGPKGTQGGSQK